MSDDLNFDMEVVDTKTAEDSSSDVGQQASSTGKEKKQGHTETPSAKLWPSIPEDWEMVAGNAVYDANPTRYAADGEVDYIEMDALKTDLSDPKYVGRRDPSDYSGQMFAEGDTLFAQITPCTENGKAALVPELESSVGIGSTEFIVLSPDETKILPRYLYYLSKSHPVHNYAVSRMRGSTGRQRVPVDVFRKELQAPLPPLPEQRKIASVLYAVDQAIQKTEAIIERAKRVKRGLMRSLLTRGIDSDNHSRSHPSENQDLYQDTRYGPVPKDWNILRVSDIVKDDKPVTYGIVQPGEYMEGGIPLIRGQNYIAGWDPLSEFFRVNPELHEQYSRCVTHPRDVLICIAGANTGAVNIVPKWVKEANLTQTTARVSVDEDVAFPEYIHFALASSFVQKQISGWTRGSAQPGLNLSRVEKFKVPIPSKAEQGRIVARLESISTLISSEEESVDRLSRVKKGLMQDLLTGEVRTMGKAIEVLGEVKAHG